jgi:hypothetical protein
MRADRSDLLGPRVTCASRCSGQLNPKRVSRPLAPSSSVMQSRVWIESWMVV